jgi:hypothetical protein
MFPLWSAFLGGSFVFLDVSPSILFLVLAFFFWVLKLFYDWQGSIISTGAFVLLVMQSAYTTIGACYEIYIDFT